jgi:hypothetical protein
MSRNARNTRFFWLMLVLLLVAAYVGIMAATTADDCGRGQETKWQYFPPRWVCVAPTFG